MPELPEVETVRRSLAGRILGRTIRRVRLLRPDIVTGTRHANALLLHQRITAVERHGKQLALVGSEAPPRSGTMRRHPPCLCFHLGMTGSLRYLPSEIRQPDSATPQAANPHIHVIWQLDDGGQLVFADPRRFGGIWTFPETAKLHAQRWARLGPDALTITPRQLHQRLAGSRRPIKPALLDQHIVAGLGNIYVDELLHACRLHPHTPAGDIPFKSVQALVRRMRLLLGRAITAGGSTLRDYVDADGRSGGFQLRHRVYGRAGQPCHRCRHELTHLTLGGRTTVFCPACQPPPG